MKVKIESEVALPCPTLRDPTDCSPPGSSVHGIFQARVLECGAIAFSGLSYLVYSNLLQQSKLIKYFDHYLTEHNKNTYISYILEVSQVAIVVKTPHANASRLNR